MHRAAWLMIPILAGVLAVHTDAAADPNLVVVEPANLVLDLGTVNIGATSTPGRIRVQNIGTTVVVPTIDLQARGVFEIVGWGGSLGPGEEAYWDITASPTLYDLENANDSARFVISYPVDDDYDIEINVGVFCRIRRTPFDAQSVGFIVGPFTTTTKTITITNTSAAAKTITALSSPDPVFTVKLRSGALPVTIPPEASFDLDVTFAPTVPSAVYQGDIGIALDDGSSAYGSFVFGITFSIMWLEDLPGVAWYGVPLGETWVKRSRLINYGDTPQTITGISLDDDQFIIVGVAAGTVIPPRASVPVTVAFSPRALGPLFSHLTMTFGNAADITGIIDGDGIAPLVRVTTEDAAPRDGQLELGDIELGSAPVTRGITITNISAHDIATSRCEAPASDGFVPTTECPSFIVLAPGDSIHVDFVFTPSQVGRHVAVLTFSGNGMNYQIRVGISAQVTQHAFALSQSTVAFADTVRYPSAPTTADVTVTNTGTEPLDVPAAQIDGSGFSLVAGPPPGVILPSQSVSYTVGFNPTASAVYDAMLVLGAPASPLARVPLHGAGILRPITAAAELDLGAAEIGSTVRAQVALHNAGAVAVAISSATTGHPRFRAIAPPGLTIPAGGDRALEVEYTPTAIGQDSTTLAIHFDGDPDPQLTIALRGEATTDAPASGGCRIASSTGATPLVILAAALALFRRRKAHRL